MKNLTLFYVMVMPWLLALVFAIALSLSFSIQFCIAFLLTFGVTTPFWNNQSLSLAVGVFFSLMLGVAYGLGANSARWGLTASLVYAVILSLLLGPLSGLAIGAAFLIGYFRILLYAVEAPLSWILAALATRGDAVRLWQFQPVQWDELIWFPLPRLDQHLLAIKKQDGLAAQTVILHVEASFRQRWAAMRIIEES